MCFGVPRVETNARRAEYIRCVAGERTNNLLHASRIEKALLDAVA